MVEVEYIILNQLIGTQISLKIQTFNQQLPSYEIFLSCSFMDSPETSEELKHHTQNGCSMKTVPFIYIEWSRDS